jgi:hypothetical protein
MRCRSTPVAAKPRVPKPLRFALASACVTAWVLLAACGETSTDAATGGDGGWSGGGAGVSGSGTGGAAAGTAGSGGLSGGTAGGGGGGAGEGGYDAGASDAAGTGGQLPDIQRTCFGKVLQCGDGIDNDGDGLVDADDLDCYGVCQNTEAWFYPGVPDNYFEGCWRDCYFDIDGGSGNDECYWDHSCDPHSLPPTYNPSGKHTCEYNPSTQVFTKSGAVTCEHAKQTQGAPCLGFCGPLTPNGCDCFGCCELAPGSGSYRWLGSTDASGVPTCSISSMNDPTQCRPCEPVPACLNTCEACELCIGGKLPAAGCAATAQCPAGIQACGLPGQPRCPPDTYCVTGCCQPAPQ